MFKKFLSKAVTLSILVAGTLIVGQADAMNIGVKSADAQSGGAVTQALNRSRDLRQQGLSELNIMQQTGWYKGADGRERYRIDDDARYVDFSCVDNKNGSYQVKDLYKNPDFIRNYPQIANLPVKFDYSGNDHSASFKGGKEYSSTQHTDNNGKLVFGYNPDKVNGIDVTKGGYVSLNPNMIENDDFSKGIIVHELQHAIQNIEGFAICGSESEYLDFATRYGGLDAVEKYVKGCVGFDVNSSSSTDYMGGRFVNFCYGRDFKGKLLDQIGNASINSNDEGAIYQKAIACSDHANAIKMISPYQNKLAVKDRLYAMEVFNQLHEKYWGNGGLKIDFKDANDALKISDWMKQACNEEKNFPETLRFGYQYLHKVDGLCNGNAYAPVRAEYFGAWGKAVVSNNVQYLYDYFNKWDSGVLLGNGRSEIASDFRKIREKLTGNGDLSYMGYLSIAGEYEGNVVKDLMFSNASKAEKDRIAFESTTRTNQIFATLGDTSGNYLTYDDFYKISSNNIKVKGNVQKNSLEIFVKNATTGETKSVGYYDKNGVAHGELPISYEQAKDLYYGRPQ